MVDKLLNIVGNLIFAILIVLAVGEGILIFSPRFTQSTVSSASMYPYFDIGSVVVIDKGAYEKKKPEVGDVVVYVLTDDSGNVMHSVMHRIIGENENGTYKTKGDNNDSMDSWEVPMNHITGKVVYHSNLIAPLMRAAMHY